ncbi:hypothetical protein [Tessaracoccus sp. ZS01]|uniref:hypothetical protein n=1 Tax=Tessaracoccus sp. ZS01 TaxID=1906324 RepID=UPI00096C26C1|nr:hypothetical protein [Tessaracoccus sp. ZS01]MCG6567512.1 hypothetical protein [Tessaracoccus sp. ZS01]OMG55878.1 hypothetical protein BJN44_07755 [Tessaracoccus sp. ZS01]
MSTLAHSKLGLAALYVAALVAALFVAMFFVPSAEPRAWVFTGAFLVGLVALVLAAGGSLERRGEPMTLRPKTAFAWWSLGLMAVGIAVFQLAVMTPFRFDDGTEFSLLPPPVLAGIGFLLMVGAGVVALLAWFRRNETSWLVLLPLLPALFSVYFVIGEFAFPH